MRINKYDAAFYLALILWAIETAYFGFNKVPINGWERLMDHIAMAVGFYGIVGSFISAIKTPSIQIISNKNMEIE